MTEMLVFEGKEVWKSQMLEMHLVCIRGLIQRWITVSQTHAHLILKGECRAAGRKQNHGECLSWGCSRENHPWEQRAVWKLRGTEQYTLMNKMLESKIRDNAPKPHMNYLRKHDCKDWEFYMVAFICSCPPQLIFPIPFFHVLLSPIWFLPSPLENI